MSGQFKSGSRNYHGSVLSVSSTGTSDIVKQLHKLEEGGEKAIKRTVSDFASRAPAKVSKGIRQFYGVDTAAIKEASQSPKRGRTTIQIAGNLVDGITLEYKGRTLTPTHFSMSPKSVNPKGLTDKSHVIPGQAISFKGTPGSAATVRIPKPYTVKATIIKGQRVAMKPETFMAAGNGGAVLPYQRAAGSARGPIEAVRTLSVPQMIDGKAHDTIQQTIEELLEDRFYHNLEQAIK